MARQREKFFRPLRKVRARYEAHDGFWRERLECGHFVQTRPYIKLTPNSRRRCYDCPRELRAPRFWDDENGAPNAKPAR